MRERNFMRMMETRFLNKRHICVGLDTDPKMISEEIEAFIRKEYVLPPSAAIGPLIRGFNAHIIKSTRDLVCAYKLNLGFYLAQGLQGLWAMKETIEFIHKIAPWIPVILDGKFGDIGSSAAQYAHFAFIEMNADAVTVNPWGGREDSVDAFLEYKDKGIFVWCQSSNGGYHDFQWRERTGLMAAIKTAREWNGHGNCGVVAGATYPDKIADIRKCIDGVPLLIPAIGAQGGELGETIKVAIYTDQETGIKLLPAIINSSRGIIYASSGEDFAECAHKEVVRLNREITKYKNRANKES